MSATTLTAEPGGEVTGQVTVRNAGTVVDEFTCEVVGDAAAWARVEPPTVSLFPGAEEQVTVHFRPPRDHRVRAGVVPFGVKVASQQDPEGSTVEEGLVEVTPFVDTTAELLPRTTRGRRRTRHELAVDNRGNAPLIADLHAADADEILTFAIAPAELTAEPGQAVFARVMVRPRKRFWRGPPKTHPFQVIVEPAEGVPLAVDGTMLQEPIIPKWLPKVLLLLLLLAAALVALWFALLRPALESAAKSAAEEQAEELRSEQAAIAEQAAAAEKKAEDAQAAAGSATKAANATEPAQDGGDGTGGTAIGAQALGEPFDFRLARSVVAGGRGEATFEVPAGQQIALTDILLQNPSADRGVMQILRRTPEFDSVLLEVRLENFRDLDYHFVSPVVFTARNDVVMLVDCRNPGDRACNAAAYFSGFRGDAERASEPSN